MQIYFIILSFYFSFPCVYIYIYLYIYKYPVFLTKHGIIGLSKPTLSCVCYKSKQNPIILFWVIEGSRFDLLFTQASLITNHHCSYPLILPSFLLFVCSLVRLVKWRGATKQERCCVCLQFTSLQVTSHRRRNMCHGKPLLMSLVELQSGPDRWRYGEETNRATVINRKLYAYG